MPRCRLVKMEIFGLEEMAWKRSSAPHQDTPLFGEGSREFDQREMHRDPDVFATEVGNPVSTRGYQSQLGAHRGGQTYSKKKSRLHPFPQQEETSDCMIVGAPLTEHGNEVGGGARHSSGSWSRHSSLHQSGGAAFEPSSHHLEDDVNVGDE